MKHLPILRLSLAAAMLAAGTAQTIAQAPTAAPVPVETKAKVIPTLKIPDGLLSEALEQLERALQAAEMPEMNLILSPQARNIKAPELLLRNVSGPDALQLIAVSTGCEVDPVEGAEGNVIGYRIFPAGGEIAHLPPPSLGGQDHFDTGSGHEPHAYPGGTPSRGSGSLLPAGAGMPGDAAMSPGTADPFGRQGGQGSYNPPGGVMAFSGTMGGMPHAAENAVRVYSLGDITKTIKFADVESTLRDILKAGGVSAEAAKLALHERTNVLVVTAEYRAHELVSQYLAALQKNAAMAAEEEKRDAGRRQDVIEARIQLQAEQDQRKRLSMQLDEAEARLRETQRELDRLKTVAPKPQ